MRLLAYEVAVCGADASDDGCDAAFFEYRPGTDGTLSASRTAKMDSLPLGYALAVGCMYPR